MENVLNMWFGEDTEQSEGTQLVSNWSAHPTVLWLRTSSRCSGDSNPQSPSSLGPLPSPPMTHLAEMAREVALGQTLSFFVKKYAFIDHF